MQKSNDNQKAMRARRQIQSATTLNRKYVKKPTNNVGINLTVRRSQSIQHFAKQDIKSKDTKQLVQEQPIAPAKMHPIQNTVSTRMKSRAESAQSTPKLTAKQLKEQAIQKALINATKTSADETNSNKKQLRKFDKTYFGFGRVLLALSCATIAILAIVLFVKENMPDLPLSFAAADAGIEASYPGYTPRDFSLSGIISEAGKITLNFSNNTTGDGYSIIEEKSSWDSNALLTNFVKSEYGENYTIIREQGLTIYVSGSDAAWTNGGIVYKLNSISGSLSKKQISAIATSLK